MPKIAKKRQARIEAVESTKVYSLADAVKIVKAGATSKFDETIDVVVNLGVDPKAGDQQVRGLVSLPGGTGKSVRVAVFAKGDKAAEAQKAGADLVGAEDLAEKINNGESGFDRVIATPDMMAVVGRLGKVLGPKGLMPNPKLGTVTPNVGEAVKAAKAGQVEFRIEKAGIVHAGVAKASFSEETIVKNIRAFMDAVTKAKPQGVKGNYINRVGISSTMGVGLKVDIASTSAA